MHAKHCRKRLKLSAAEGYVAPLQTLAKENGNRLALYNRSAATGEETRDTRRENELQRPGRYEHDETKDRHADGTCQYRGIVVW